MIGSRTRKKSKRPKQSRLAVRRVKSQKMVEITLNVPRKSKEDFLDAVRTTFGEGQLPIDVAVQSALMRWIKQHNPTVKYPSDPKRTADSVRGKYKGLIKVSQEQMEEDQERFVRAGRR